jgi:hypothetical protein
MNERWLVLRRPPRIEESLDPATRMALSTPNRFCTRSGHWYVAQLVFASLAYALGSDDMVVITGGERALRHPRRQYRQPGIARGC